MVLCAAVPAAQAEGLGVIRAFKRSWSLVTGSRAALFGVFLSVALANLVVSWVVDAHALGAVRPALMASVLFSAVTASVSACIGVVAFHLMRLREDGASPAALARTFD